MPASARCYAQSHAIFITTGTYLQRQDPGRIHRTSGLRTFSPGK